MTTDYICNDPGCWCCHFDEALKNEDQEQADKERREAKRAERRARRKGNA